MFILNFPSENVLYIPPRVTIVISSFEYLSQLNAFKYNKCIRRKRFDVSRLFSKESKCYLKSQQQIGRDRTSPHKFMPLRRCRPKLAELHAEDHFDVSDHVGCHNRLCFNLGLFRENNGYGENAIM